MLVTVPCRFQFVPVLILPTYGLVARVHTHRTRCVWILRFTVGCGCRMRSAFLRGCYRFAITHAFAVALPFVRIYGLLHRTVTVTCGCRTVTLYHTHLWLPHCRLRFGYCYGSGLHTVIYWVPLPHVLPFPVDYRTTFTFTVYHRGSYTRCRLVGYALPHTARLRFTYVPYCTRSHIAVLLVTRLHGYAVAHRLPPVTFGSLPLHNAGCTLPRRSLVCSLRFTRLRLGYHRV